MYVCVSESLCCTLEASRNCKLTYFEKKIKNEKVPRKSESPQSCLTFCDPMDCSPPDSSVHGILQAKILEWAAISFSRGSSQPRDRTQVSDVAGRPFTL